MVIDMKRTWFLISTSLLWLALPLTAFRYWMVWDQLPARMATHFDASGHPNGWMSRETSLWFALGLTAFMLAIFTLVPYLVTRSRGISAAFCWASVAFAWVLVGFVFYVNNSLIEYNLTSRPIAMAPVLLIVPIAIVVLTALFLASGRGPSLMSATSVAEETHASWSADVCERLRSDPVRTRHPSNGAADFPGWHRCGIVGSILHPAGTIQKV